MRELTTSKSASAVQVCLPAFPVDTLTASLEQRPMNANATGEKRRHALHNNLWLQD